LSPEIIEEDPLVSVVIPCFNQARFLGEAIESVRAQTFRNFEIVVIDDGSTDGTAETAQRYPEVRYSKQTNQGLAAARNAGIEASRGRYLVFLDADDRLLSNALGAGLQCIEAHIDCAFVSGGHVRIDEAGVVIEEPTPPADEEDNYLALLRGNYVGMHGAVMYRRSHLAEAGGFDPSLPVCEDYDVYLRLARIHPVRCHDAVVAQYRTYDETLSGNSALMLRTVLEVLRSQREYLQDDLRRAVAYGTGQRYWKGLYASQFVAQLKRSGTRGAPARLLRDVLGMAGLAPKQLSNATYRQVVRPVLPPSILRLLARVRGYPYYPSVGRVRFGDLRRVTPISGCFGFDRGLPIDRHYIERFLGEHAQAIRGRTLEIGDANYTRRFGGDRVTRSDVLHVKKSSRVATIVGDLTSAEHIPSESFDCIIATQTLQLIYDVRAALATLHRILKPDGLLLLTAPGISQISQDEWAETWYWSFTSRSLVRLLEEVFPPSCVEVEAFGNVLAAGAFLQGLAAGELTHAELDARDPQYEVLITVRARKTSSGTERA
jgi:glycosyltransferase involved in cell wall biosynthesis